MEKNKYLQVIIKTVERCNINCSYCYVFNMQDDSYLRHPIYISNNTINDIAIFLKQACIDYSLEHIGFIFIGGEPMMQKKKDFDAMCCKFQSTLGDFAKIYFSMQTNGMLIDEEWISLFNKYNVGVGISLDGTKEYNDKYRVDHRNKGTYDRVVEKIKLMQKLYSGQISILSVINPDHSSKKIYQHFVHDLGVKMFDFLLPDYNYENKPKDFSAAPYGKFLRDLFDSWVNDLQSGVNIRLIGSLFNALFFQKGSLCGQGPARPQDLPLVSIASNGELSPMDELRNTDPSLVLNSKLTVKNTSLMAFYEQQKIFSILSNAQLKLPKECLQCCWKSICNAGALPNRYNKEKQFDNPSLYCDGLKDYYSHIAAFLIKNGYDQQQLLQELEIAC
jgi:uncharacterized protein